MLLCIRMVVIYDYIQILGTKYRYCIHVPFLPSILTSGLAVTSNKDWRFLISCIDPLEKYSNLHIKIASLFISHRRRIVVFGEIKVGWFISWRSVLLVEETRLHGENHRPLASHWQTLSHNVVSSTPRHERGSNSQL